MTTKSSTDSSYTVRLDRSDVVRAEDGDYLVPVLLGDEARQTPVHLKIRPDDAARLHAQLDRLLSRGWALTESTKVGNQNGEIYPVSGSGHLRED